MSLWNCSWFMGLLSTFSQFIICVHGCACKFASWSSCILQSIFDILLLGNKHASRGMWNLNSKELLSLPNDLISKFEHSCLLKCYMVVPVTIISSIYTNDVITPPNVQRLMTNVWSPMLWLYPKQFMVWENLLSHVRGNCYNPFKDFFNLHTYLSPLFEV